MKQMSSLARMLEIVDLYSVEQPLLTVDDITTRLGYSKGSTYRYLKELTNAGLLTNAAGGYAPGPRVIELDFVIRRNDPYSGILLPIMQNLANRLQFEVLACCYYRGRVVVNHRVRGTDEMTMSYGRGRRMPLFLGAGSKAILSSMPKKQLVQLFEGNPGQRSLPGVAQDWDTFFTEIKAIRRRGYSTSFSELDQGNVGIATPLKVNPFGSLVLVITQKRYDIIDQKRVADTLLAATEQANALIANVDAGGPSVDWLSPSGRPGSARESG